MPSGHHDCKKVARQLNKDGLVKKKKKKKVALCASFETNFWAHMYGNVQDLSRTFVQGGHSFYVNSDVEIMINNL
jgi:hypothetical protein